MSDRYRGFPYGTDPPPSRGGYLAAFQVPMPHAGLSQLAGGMVEVERTKHPYQAEEFFGLGIKGVAGAWRLAELIDVGRVSAFMINRR